MAQQVAATAGHAVIFAITVYELWDIVRKKSRRYLASHLSVILLKQGEFDLEQLYELRILNVIRVP